MCKKAKYPTPGEHNLTFAPLLRGGGRGKKSGQGRKLKVTRKGREKRKEKMKRKGNVGEKKRERGKKEKGEKERK